MVHIVLLIQSAKSARTKKWEDFESMSDCCRYICEMFEARLKRENPFLPKITYDITDLYAFVDNVSLSGNCDCHSFRNQNSFPADGLELPDKQGR